MTLRTRRTPPTHGATPPDPTDHRDRVIGRVAWLAAWVGLVVGQLHALARFRTADGQEDLATGWTAAWAEPADRLLSPLLDWADPEIVYVTYGKVWFPVFLAFTLGALTVYRRTRPTGVLKWSWRAALAAYATATTGVLLGYWTQWTGDLPAAGEELAADGIEQTLFVLGWFVSFPGVMLTLLCSTLLGVTLLATRFRPALPAALLALTVPLAAVLLLGTSLGSAVLPVVFAFGLLGRRIARSG